jgi:hypothetical protein
VLSVLGGANPASVTPTETSQWTALADLGLDAMSLEQAYPGDLPGFSESAAAVDPVDPIEMEYYTAGSGDVWTTGLEWTNLEIRARCLNYTRTGVDDACFGTPGSTWSQPTRWHLFDEPWGRNPAACRSSLAGPLANSDLRPTVASELQAAMDDAGCLEDADTDSWTCTAEQASQACEVLLPGLLEAAAVDLRALIGVDDLAIGLNLGLEGLVEWHDRFDGGFDYLSVTNNWLSGHPPKSWHVAPGELVGGTSIAAIGYLPVIGSGGRLAWSRAPTAAEQRAMAWFHLVQGAVGLRTFRWPPHTVEVLDGLTDLTLEFSGLAPDVPQQRRLPAPLVSTPGVVTGWFDWGGSDLVVAVNRTERRTRVRIDVRGLQPCATPLGVEPDSINGEGGVVSDALELVLEPFSVETWVLDPGPCPGD